MFLSITNSIFDFINYSKSIYKNARAFLGYDKPVVFYIVYNYFKTTDSDNEYETINNTTEENEQNNKTTENEQNNKTTENEQENEQNNKTTENEQENKVMLLITKDINKLLNETFDDYSGKIIIEEYVSIGDNEYFFIHKPKYNNKDFHLSLMITQFFRNNYEYVLKQVKSQRNFILATLTDNNNEEMDDILDDIEPLIYYSQIYPELFSVSLNDFAPEYNQIDFLLKDCETKTFNNNELILF